MYGASFTVPSPLRLSNWLECYIGQTLKVIQVVGKDLWGVSGQDFGSRSVGRLYLATTRNVLNCNLITTNGECV